MALYKLEELVAYQLSMDLKKQVFDLIYNSPAQHDSKLAAQISGTTHRPTSMKC